jgi:hypothetical protein
MGVDVDRLIADTERCLTELERVGDAGGSSGSTVR